MRRTPELHGGNIDYEALDEIPDGRRGCIGTDDWRNGSARRHGQHDESGYAGGQRVVRSDVVRNAHPQAFV